MKRKLIQNLDSIVSIRLVLFLFCAIHPFGLADAQEKLGMDLSGRQLWHINALVSKLVKSGEIPEEVATQHKKRKDARKAELTKLKIGYMRIGVRAYHELTNPASSITETEYAELKTEGKNAVTTFHMFEFRDLIALYQSFPETVKTKLKNGDYDDIMPKKWVNKRNPHWVEESTAKVAKLTEDQTRAWNAIHQTYLEELNRFNEDVLPKVDAKREAALYYALFAGDEKAARKAYEADLEIHLKPDLMKFRQLRKLFAILTDEQKAVLAERSVKTYDKQKVSVEKFSFDKKK